MPAVRRPAPPRPAAALLPGVSSLPGPAAAAARTLGTRHPFSVPPGSPPSGPADPPCPLLVPHPGDPPPPLCPSGVPTRGPFPAPSLVFSLGTRRPLSVPPGPPPSGPAAPSPGVSSLPGPAPAPGAPWGPAAPSLSLRGPRPRAPPPLGPARRAHLGADLVAALARLDVHDLAHGAGCGAGGGAGLDRARTGGLGADPAAARAASFKAGAPPL